ncbi:ATP-binding protein [Alteromonas sp. KUL49]|uniref:ATP-binding protein n=1 Tax=Alteromonas sp. KUL49 TaxID=2480798 RepID=UPI00102F1D93|nr:ATP-binding protein [Alteromonas sp. KUL49]TAP37363.1 hypothetical protein EYS00_16630 [Alteromonas sp. KUL49]GEA12997.1 two-component sensor histidine kinase [Alteromonas sp. KUL49]
MKRQFYRLYGLILLVGCLLVFSFNQLINALEKQTTEYQINVDYLFTAYEQEFESGGEQKLPRFSYVLLEDLALTPNLQARLLKGETVSLLDTHGLTFYYRISNKHEQALRFGPFYSEPPKSDYVPYLIVVFYGCLGLTLLAFMRPLFKDLFALQRQAIRFGVKPQHIPLSITRSSSIYPLASALSTMSEKLVSLLQLHRDLSRTLSHEVRTPLSRMKFLLEILSPSIESEDKKQLFDDIREIEAMLETYLNFAKADNASVLVCQKVHYIRALFKVIAPKYAMHRHTLDIRFTHNTEKANFDRNLMLLALQNLIINSIRYARKTIAVDISIVGDEYSLTVEDDGPGVCDEATQLIQVFQRGSDEQDETSGFGLGLYIVQTAALKHRGCFSIETSQRLGGAKMCLRWPRMT